MIMCVSGLMTDLEILFVPWGLGYVIARLDGKALEHITWCNLT
jgi:hypothetical protein